MFDPMHARTNIYAYTIISSLGELNYVVLSGLRYVYILIQHTCVAIYRLAMYFVYQVTVLKLFSRSACAATARVHELSSSTRGKVGAETRTVRRPTVTIFGHLTTQTVCVEFVPL